MNRVTWHAVQLSPAEVESGRMREIGLQVGEASYSANDPGAMAVFARSEEGGGCTLFFAPAMASQAAALLLKVNAVPCRKPDDTGELALVHGYAGAAWQLLSAREQ